MGQDWLKPEMRRLLSSEETRAVLSFSFFLFHQFKWKWFCKVTVSCKNLFSLWQDWGNYFSTEPISFSHHRGWRQTWQKIRWRVMCLPVVLEVSWLWSTKMESFLMLSLHSPLARAETLVPLVTVISQSDGKRESRKKIISSPNLCCWCNKLRDSNYSGSREYPWESQKMTELPSEPGN